MKILFIPPCFDEIRDDKNKELLFIHDLTYQISKCKNGSTSFTLDVSSVSAGETSVSELLKVVKNMPEPIENFDIIHTFSVLPFIFRNIFPQLIIYSLDHGSIDEKFLPFIPETDAPGSARYDISSLTSTAVCELYSDIFNNRRKFDTRPWGWWKSLVLSGNYKVKQIYVSNEEKLSLQTHKFRSEIWVIAQGNGWVTVGDKRMNAERGSVFNINRGEIHRAEGGEGGLYIIELQIGDYLGEDDIIRLEVIYGRK